MPIGKVWIYRLLFVCLFVCVCVFVLCTVTDFSGEDKASGVKFSTVVHGRPRQGISHFVELCFPRSPKSDESAWRVGVGSACVDKRPSRRRTYLLSRHQLHASAARRAACRSRGQRQRRSPARGHGNAVRVTSILGRGQFSSWKAETRRPSPSRATAHDRRKLRMKCGDKKSLKTNIFSPNFVVQVTIKHFAWQWRRRSVKNFGAESTTKMGL